MRILFSLILSVIAISANTLLAQDMPADIKAKVVEKSQKLFPNNKVAAKAWCYDQDMAWQSIQYSSYSISAQELKVLKDEAQKKFPYEFQKQETYINDQANYAQKLVEYKAKFGAKTYAEILKVLKAKGLESNRDIEKAMKAQFIAKKRLETYSPYGVDASTLSATKEALAKKMPYDYDGQFKQLKEQLKNAQKQVSANAGTSGSTSPVAKNKSFASKNNESKRSLTINDRQRIAREQFQNQSFIVEGSKKSVGIAMEISGRQVVILPFSAFALSGMTITNALGENIEYSANDVVASKTLPIIAIFPKSLPANTQNVSLLNEKDFKNIIGNTSIIVGYSNNSINSAPIKVASISNNNLTLATRIPVSYIEGSLLLDSNTFSAIGMLVANRMDIPKMNWTDRTEVNKLKRTLEKENARLRSVRIDKLSAWEKINPEKFEKQQKKISELKAANTEILELIQKKRLADFESSDIIGKIAQKYIREFKTRMDESRYTRIFRNYAQDINSVLKTALRDMNPNEFYTLFRGEVIQQIAIANGIMSAFNDALSEGKFDDLTPREAQKKTN